MKKILFLFSFVCCNTENENPSTPTFIDHENNKYHTNPKDNSKINFEKNDSNSQKDDKEKDNQNENNFKNILLVGLSGSGKSSFVNFISGKNLAKAATQARAGITKEIDIYKIEDLKINLIDTPSSKAENLKNGPIWLNRLTHKELCSKVKEFCKNLKINKIILLCKNDVNSFSESLSFLFKISLSFPNISKKIFIQDDNQNNKYFNDYIKSNKEYFFNEKINEEDIFFLDIDNQEEPYKSKVINQLIK
jgi:hypothetical protein